MPLRHAALAAALALAALPLRAEDTIVFVSARNHLVAYDLATGAERARFATPGLSSDMMVTRDGVLLLNHRDGDTILVVDARRLRELARIPSSSMGGRRPVHGYLTPVIGGQQFFVALNDGVSTPGQPNTDNTALFIDVTPGSPTYLKPAGEVRLGQGHHKAAFHPTLPRMAVSNINDCEEIVGVYDFANPAAIRRVPSSDARRLGLDGSSEAKTCTPTASRPGVRPAPHGAATEPVSGLAVHNLNGTGQFVLVDMGAEPSSFTALATRGWGGAAIGVHPFGRWLYGPQYAPREGDRRAPGLPCQVGQIAVIDGAKASVVTEIPVLKDGPDCTRSLAGTPEAGARLGYVAVAPRGDKLFLPLGTLGPETTRSSAVAVFDLSEPQRPVRRASIAVGLHNGHRDMAMTGDGTRLLVPANIDNTLTVIDMAKAEAVRSFPVTATPNRVATFSPTSGPSKPAGPPPTR
jgi:DNA-binding beta-propeller fold protein YncE